MQICRLLTFTIIIIAITPEASAQHKPDNFNKRAYQSYVKGEMSDWKAVMKEMESIENSEKNNEMLHDLLILQYGYIGYCIKENRKKEARWFLDKAQKNIEILCFQNPGNAEYTALHGALLAFEMAINKLKVVYLGSKTVQKIDDAINLDKECVRALIEKGNQLNYSPKILGGNPEEALDYYKKAVIFLEASPLALKENWIYVNTLIVMAAGYMDLMQFSNACDIYEKLMTYDPEIKWVSSKLYPACVDEMKATNNY